jgi:hypothetical protein
MGTNLRMTAHPTLVAPGPVVSSRAISTSETKVWIGGPTLGAHVLRVAWLSVLLGLTIEALLLAAAACFGKSPVARPVIADIVQKVSWSTLVCIGLALGTAATKSKVKVMGIAGLLSAPIAFHVARVLHKGMTQALAGASVAAAPTPLVLLTIIKAAQYATLGAVLARLGKREPAGVGTYALVGLLTGLVFGGSTIAVLARFAIKPLGPADFVARGINEVVFPVGCALVLHAAESIGRRLAK